MTEVKGAIADTQKNFGYFFPWVNIKEKVNDKLNGKKHLSRNKILTMYLVSRRKAKNDNPITMDCQFHCKYIEYYII
jgi:hypothetical protein